MSLEGKNTPRKNRLLPGIDRLPSGKYRVRIRRHGLPLYTGTFERLEDAEGQRRKVLYEGERGLWLDTGDAANMTLRQAMDRYAGEVSVHHRGAAIERATLRVMQSEPIAHKTLAAITREDVRTLRDRMRDVNEYAIATINRRLGLLAAIFSTAQREWGMPGLANPAHDMKLKGERRRARRVSDKELQAWLAASDSPELAAFMRLAVESAMRRGEISALEWKHVDFARAVAFLPTTKNGEPREVPLSSRAIQCLHEIKANGTGQASVFASDPHSYTTAARRALRRARAAYVAECVARRIQPDPKYLLDIHLHDLRHEAASRLASKFAAHELAKITGHKDPRMLMRYYHPDASEFAKRMG